VDSVKLFLDSCRSLETRNVYQISLQKYLDFVGSEELFFQYNPRVIEAKIIDFILFLKTQNKSYAAILNYLNAVKGYYKINDIVLNVNKISRFLPEQMKVNKDRAYTHEEISRMLDVADERMRVVIFVLASTGIRLGALSSIKLHNLRDNKMTIYENTKEEYITFITPECKKAIDFYLDMRSRYGENLINNSYLIREQFDIRDQFEIRNPKKVTPKSIQSRLVTLAEKSGIRKKGNDKKIRQNIMIAHGFRKFFTTQLINSKVNPEIREMLLGHKIGLASAYYRPTEEEMLEEYMRAVNNLTINQENKLHVELEQIKKEQDEILLMKLEHRRDMNMLREQTDKKLDRILSIIRANSKLAGVKTEVLTNI
jgi:integrase